MRYAIVKCSGRVIPVTLTNKITLTDCFNEDTTLEGKFLVTIKGSFFDLDDRFELMPEGWQPRTPKNYKCDLCGATRVSTTNHYGKIYDRCPNCSWKTPMTINTATCLDQPPQ